MKTKQGFKTIYFSDYPKTSSKERNLTLAFGKRYQKVYDLVRKLSSTEMKELIGSASYGDIVSESVREDLPINTLCLRKIRKALNDTKSSGQHVFDPISATFREGGKDPYVRWYPYLEGYSISFVKEIIRRFSPDAKKILDPFAGTGTTAFAASENGVLSMFCEINPVLQHITQTKIRARMLKKDKRIALSESLLEIENKISELGSKPKDEDLRRSYKDTFFKSRFFRDVVFEDILRLRSWVDEINIHNQLLADLFSVAVVSCLVPVSNMKRAGDLRYKTEKELRKERQDLSACLSEKIKSISSDLLLETESLNPEPFFICDSAQNLGNIPNQKIDTVITSPPYVNGTNYFRNTKLELWFLRCLNESKDLTRFRSTSLTAGINDVTSANSSKSDNAAVRKIVKELESVAYDMRIPKMIDSYFAELTSIFQSIQKHLRKGAVLAIDIGDSEYCGVHVPVDELLAGCLGEIGFSSQETIVLRERQSRSGRKLKQVLQIYSYDRSRKRSSLTKETGGFWSNSWIKFKNDLPHQMTPYSKRNWGNNRHSLCSYMGKLKPSIAHHLVDAFVPEDGRILDPFAGVGTIPFEASLKGMASYGFDISPAAVAISKAKIANPSRKDCMSIIKKLSRYIHTNEPSALEVKEVKNLGFNGKIETYFEKNTMKEVILARRFFQNNPPTSSAENFILAALLHILHGNRPYALSRRSHPITPYKPQGEFEYKSLINKLTEKVERSLSVELPSEFKEGHIYLQDATTWWPREIENLDAIITSPPFFDSTRFHVANWMRLWFSGWSKDDFASRPQGFVDDRQKVGFSVYEPIFRQSRERLKKNGVLVLHLGKSNKCDMAEVLQHLGKKWFRKSDLLNESVAHCESHGIKDKGTVTSHQYLVLH